jgi:outer membrane protein
VNHRTLMFLIPCVMAVCAGSAAAQTAQKTGFVNSAKIFQELPEAKDAEKRLEAFTKPVQDSLQLMQKDIETRISEYQKKESMMNDQAKRTSQSEIQEMTQRAREFASRKDQELAAQRERILNPLKEKVLRAIERVAKEDKYTFVFDQTEQVQILLYGDPNHDLTFKVIDRLKRGK